ncbi:MAG TPA: UbiA family prenyltransferase [Actinocrinis sp.]|nr:UbiA family prenyltransferase [Actinocrinis sp.]
MRPSSRPAGPGAGRAAAFGHLNALIRTSHLGPSLAITGMISLLVARAAPHGIGPVLVPFAVLAGELSIGWSNDVFDAPADAAAGRADKPVATGRISARAVFAAACVALAAAVVPCFAIGTSTGIVNVVMLAAGWAYNAGLKGTLASGLLYAIGFGLIPEFAASTLPGHPLARPWALAVAALLGLGAHFANVLPDLAGDRAAGVRGLPQRVAEAAGAGAVRLVALVLLLGASAMIALAPGAGQHRIAQAGFAAAAVLAVVGARAAGRGPFLAAIAIAAIDTALFAVGGVILT